MYSYQYYVNGEEVTEKVFMQSLNENFTREATCGLFSMSYTDIDEIKKEVRKMKKDNNHYLFLSKSHGNSREYHINKSFIGSAKTFPTIGDKLYLQKETGSYYVDLCKNPYTVIEVNNNIVKIQACRLIFLGPRYFDTLPDCIENDPYGKIKILHWAPKKGVWQYKYSKNDRYPEIAHFGDWEYQPYLD